MLVARRRDRLESLAECLRQRFATHVEVIVADLTQADELRSIEGKLQSNSVLDMLVNNAGFGTAGSFAGLSADREEREIRLNVVAGMRLTRAALPGMIGRKRGAIINVSSIVAFQPGPYQATYAATKAYLNSFSEALHEELRGTGVRVQLLCPGFTRTEFMARAGIDPSQVPSFVWMTPEAVVNASFRALRARKVICVPGFWNRCFALVVSSIPRFMNRRVAGVMGRGIRYSKVGR